MYQRKRPFFVFSMFTEWYFLTSKLLLEKKLFFLTLICALCDLRIFNSQIIFVWNTYTNIWLREYTDNWMFTHSNDQDFGNTIIFLKVILKDNFPCWIFDLVGYQFNCLCQIRICSYTIQNDVNDLISPSFNNFCCQGYEKLQ